MDGRSAERITFTTRLVMQERLLGEKVVLGGEKVKGGEKESGVWRYTEIAGRGRHKTAYAENPCCCSNADRGQQSLRHGNQTQKSHLVIVLTAAAQCIFIYQENIWMG